MSEPQIPTAPLTESSSFVERASHTRDWGDTPPPVPDGATYIKLTRGRYAIVDEDMWWELSQYNWQYSEDKSGYGVATRWKKGGGKVQMHRQVANCHDPDLKVDHINGNSLDDRRENLRVCTHQQNAHNVAKRRDGVTSEYKGVWIHKRSGKYESQITVNGRTQHIGMFGSPDVAALAYNFAALLYYDEFAFLNVIPGYTDTRGIPLTDPRADLESVAQDQAFAKGGIVLPNDTTTERPESYT